MLSDINFPPQATLANSITDRVSTTLNTSDICAHERAVGSYTATDRSRESGTSAICSSVKGHCSILISSFITLTTIENMITHQSILVQR